MSQLEYQSPEVIITTVSCIVAGDVSLWRSKSEDLPRGFLIASASTLASVFSVGWLVALCFVDLDRAGAWLIQNIILIGVCAFYAMVMLCRSVFQGN